LLASTSATSRTGPSILASSRTRWILAGTAVLVLVVGVGAAFALTTWGGFDRVTVDSTDARDRLNADFPSPDDDGDGLVGEVELEGFDPSIDDGMRTALILGSDGGQDEDGVRADAILLAIDPPDDDPVIVSIPRDLWVHNRCTQTRTRINEGLVGCGDDVSGPELMSVMVEDLARIPIDHYAEVDFDGFVRIVDAVGGVEICTEHPVRDWRAGLDLPGGCVEASGDDALAWARSRRTQELVDGRWRMVPGINALVRDERQQELLLDVADQLSTFSSIGELRAVASGLQDAVVLDDHLNLTRAVALAWEYRSLDTDDVRRMTIPVTDHTTSGGAAVVLPQEDLADLLADELELGDDQLEEADRDDGLDGTD